ncbi:MAG: hypothetical protein ABTD50_23395 [Polyangiaceae bacterium]|jgi:hypothetical protein
MRKVEAWTRTALWAAFGVLLSPECSLGQGTGSVSGVLDVPDCWSGPFSLNPDFFAAVPSVSGGLETGSDAILIRIQNGGDNETFSDGLAILVDDAGEVRGDPAANGTPRPSLLGLPLIVSIPAGVTPPGVPLSPTATDSIVHASLYLDRTCRTQNVALYASDSVTLHPDGTCDPLEGGDTAFSCTQSPVAIATDAGGDDSSAAPASDAAADGSTESASAAAPIGQSTITFQALFDGNPEESDAAQRLTQASFNFYLVDPREVCPGGLGPPPPCRGQIYGNFRFYFDRGSPAQPFP